MKSNIDYDNWKLEMLVSEDSLPSFEMALDGDEVALLAMETKEGSGIWKLEAIYQDRPDMSEIDIKIELAAKSLGIDVPVYTIGALPHKNWLKDSIISFPPVTIDNYYIYGSHIKEAPPKDKIPLKIDAATAFGSGEHPTTAACIKAIGFVASGKYKKAKRVKNVLDMGCGSGILSIAAAKTFKCPILAVDIDKEATRVTSESAKTNEVSEYITTCTGNGYKDDMVKDGALYDLILANILARPLISMASDARRNLRPDGILVLSGLLQSQEDWVSSAYRVEGFTLIKKYHIGEWSALIFHG